MVSNKNKIKILIADDSPMIVKIIKNALLKNELTKFDIEEQNIFTANDGLRAFELLGKYKDISLLISDINMPGLNGDELLEILIDTGLDKKIRTLFITTPENSANISNKIKNNIMGIIYKPFSQNNFNELLENLIISYDKKLIELENNKKLQNKIKEELKNTIRAYLDEEQNKNNINFSIKNEKIDEFLDRYFDNFTILSSKEIEEILFFTIEEIISFLDLKIKIDNRKLKSIYSDISGKGKKTFEKLFLENVLEGVFNEVSDTLHKQAKPDSASIMNLFTAALRQKLAVATEKSDGYGKKRYDIYAADIEKIIHEFLDIDPYFLTLELEEAIYHLGELTNFQEKLTINKDPKKIISSIEKLKHSEKFVLEVSKKYGSYSEQLREIINSQTAKIEFLVFKEIDKSEEIVKFFKHYMPKKEPNFINSLRYFNFLNKNFEKEYEKNSTENIAVLSIDISMLHEFKKYEEKFEYYKFFCFSKLNIFETWANSNDISKIIIDYNFNSNVFSDGISAFKYINKRFKQLNKIFKYQSTYLVLKLEDFEGAREKLKDLESKNIKPHIISKPIKFEDVRDNLFYS